MAAVALGATLSSSPAPTTAATVPAGFSEAVVFSGLVNPTAVRFAPDGRVFVAEKRGVIKVFDNLSDPTATVFADLRTNVHSFWDRGLLGLALDPDLATRPYVYALYTHDAAIGGTAPRWGTAGADSDPCPAPPGGPGATGDGCVVSGRLSRLQIGAGNVMTGSENVLIEDWCQQYPSHSVGTVMFGPDKKLYVSAGDGASFTFVDYGQKGQPLNPCGDPPAGTGGAQSPPAAEGGALRSQDLRTGGDPAGLDGAILRVDPDTGAAAAGNPNAASADANARRIIAHGLRNPFRMTFRPGTEEIWVGDVGWSDWEEINQVGDANDGVVENFGWPCYEGGQRQSGYDAADLTLCEQLYASGGVTSPYFNYHHSERVVPGESCPTGGSSLAGVAYRFYGGGSYPAEYDGALFVADYSRKCIWVMSPNASGKPNTGARKTFVAGAANPVDLQTGPEGDLFYVDFDGGTIRRIRYGTTSPASCPVGQFSAEYFPNKTLTAPFTTTQCETAINYDWVQGGPATGVGVDNFSVRWTGTFDFSAATYTFTTRADDGIRLWLDGALVIDNWVDQAATTTTANRVISAGQHVVKVEYYEYGNTASASAGWQTAAGTNQAPAATITAPLTSTTWQVGDQIAFSGSATDPEQGQLPASALSWSVVLNHCPSTCHTHPIQDFPGVAGGTFTAQDHEYPSHLEFRLTATDAGGLTDTKNVLMYPRTVPLTFQSSPSGLQVAVGSSAAATPFTRTVIIGSTNSVSASSPQTLGGTQYVFSSWSDGGAQTHAVVAPSSASTYTAIFAASGDTTPPVISNVRVSQVTRTSAVITWTTNEASDSQVEYGRTSALGSSTARDPAGLTSHSQRISGLSGFTTYYYRVRSSDAAGNSATSATASFRTALL
ncbi:MAG: PQQ-dependent sugar dehydrogenase [Acidimicrobiales bacterium]